MNKYILQLVKRVSSIKSNRFKKTPLFLTITTITFLDMVNTGDEGIKNKFFCDLERLFPQEPEVDGLVQDFQNVGLESSQTDSSLHDSSDSGYNGDDSNEDSNLQHPIRPHAEDCSFFIKTGTCKFGLKCKFNHPVSAKHMVFYSVYMCLNPL